MGVKIMQYSGLKIGDVKWAYSDSTGAIPFIINERKTRVKHLDEGFVLEILDRNKSSNPDIAAVDTFGDYYNVEMQYRGHMDMMVQLNALQKLKVFGLRKTHYGEPITMDQIRYLTENYNRQMEIQGKKEAKKIAFEDAYSEEFVKTFNF